MEPLPSLQTPALSVTTCREQPCTQQLLWTLFTQLKSLRPPPTHNEGGEQSASPAGMTSQAAKAECPKTAAVDAEDRLVQQAWQSCEQRQARASPGSFLILLATFYSGEGLLALPGP